MPTRRQLIQKISLNASSTSVSFSNIPGNYTDLKLVISARTDRGNNGDSMYIRFNGDTAANYKNRSLYGTGGSGVTITFTSPVGIALTQGACGNSDTANTFGNSEAYIPNYTASTAKSTTHRGTAETNAATSYMSLDFGLWTGTAAITSMTLVPGNGTNFLTGSTFYLYGITHVPIINGGEVSIRGGYKIHTFRNTSTLQVVEPGEVEYLVIAGGGSGGHNTGGGGGAGGYRCSASGETSGGGASAEPKLRIAAGIHTITVGAGGASIPSFGNGANGSNSTFSTITATGGGGGASPNQGLASSGGSGGGGTTSFTTGGSGTTGQGFAGGNGHASSYGEGGGGGAGSVGGNGTTTNGGNGGSGVSSSIAGTTVVRAGGGGGGAGITGGALTAGSGGSGGGGNGGGTAGGATDGIVNTGSGGGGGRWTNLSGSTASGAGGSGIVIIRYPYDGN